MQRMRLDGREIAGRLAVLRFVQPDAELLRSLRPWARRHVDPFLKLFYDEQFSHPEFVEIVRRAGSSREQLERVQRMYFLSLFDGMPNAAYIEGRLRIGALHAQMRVTPRWYVSGYGLY